MAQKSDKPARPILPLLMILAGLLILSGAVLWGFNQAPAPSKGAAAPSQTPANTPSLSEIPRVTLGQARSAFDQKTAVFVDVRDAQSYASGHIPGALSIPLTDLGARLNELKSTDWIITYCT